RADRVERGAAWLDTRLDSAAQPPPCAHRGCPASEAQILDRPDDASQILNQDLVPPLASLPPVGDHEARRSAGSPQSGARLRLRALRGRPRLLAQKETSKDAKSAKAGAKNLGLRLRRPKWHRARARTRARERLDFEPHFFCAWRRFLGAQ